MDPPDRPTSKSMSDAENSAGERGIGVFSASGVDPRLVAGDGVAAATPSAARFSTSDTRPALAAAAMDAASVTGMGDGDSEMSDRVNSAGEMGIGVFAAVAAARASALAALAAARRSPCADVGVGTDPTASALAARAAANRPSIVDGGVGFASAESEAASATFGSAAGVPSAKPSPLASDSDSKVRSSRASNSYRPA